MLHPVLEDLFRAFEEAGIRWCLLRLPFDFGAPTGGDVDLLIDPADLDTVRPLLDTCGFVQIPARGRDVHTHFLSYHRATGCWIWLDIGTELSFGPHYALRTWAEEGCLARCRRDGTSVVLAPDDAFWVLLLHCLLDKGSVAVRHKARLQELVEKTCVDGPLAQVVEASCPAGWAPKRMMECVVCGDWGALEHLAPALTTTWLRRLRMGPQQMLLRRGVQLIEKLLTLRRHRGVSVALLGPDGAGKSTLATGIQNSFIFPVRLVYMGLTGGLLRHIARLHIPGLVVLCRLLVLWCRYLMAQYHQACGRLVVFDRYIYDAMVPHPERLNWLKRASRWVDGHACPGPDLVLVLNAPGEVMYARKGEYKPEQLEDWRQHFMALRHRLPQLQVIDTTRDADEVRVDVIERLWQRYAGRWRANRSAVHTAD
jgi:thymidylate kinase